MVQAGNTIMQMANLTPKNNGEAPSFGNYEQSFKDYNFQAIENSLAIPQIRQDPNKDNRSDLKSPRITASIGTIIHAHNSFADYL